MKVLAVDDDPDLLRLIKISLEAKGHAVDVRTSGLGVVNILAGWDGRERPDICILDNYMPEISGMAIINLIARTAGARNVPIIFHSADAMLDDELAKSGHPNVRFLVKGRISAVAALVGHYAVNGSFPDA